MSQFKCSMTKKKESLSKKKESLKSLRKKQEFVDWAEDTDITINGEKFYGVSNCGLNGAPGYCATFFWPDEPTSVSEGDLNKISDCVLGIINNFRNVKHYKDYLGTDVGVNETGESEVVGYIYLKDNVWEEDLDDIKFMWMRVVNELLTYCTRITEESIKKRAGVI